MMLDDAQGVQRSASCFRLRRDSGINLLEIVLSTVSPGFPRCRRGRTLSVLLEDGDKRGYMRVRSFRELG